MIKRALISGLNSTGVSVADLRTLPAPIGKHLLKTQGYDAAFHVGAASTDPEAVQIRLFEPPGIALSAAFQKEIEKLFTRQELRRVPFAAVGGITYPARARETYADDLLSELNVAAIRISATESKYAFDLTRFRVRTAIAGNSIPGSCASVGLMHSSVSIMSVRLP